MIAPDTPLAAAWDIMVTCRIRHLPVVRDGLLLGIVSDRDALLHSRATEDTIIPPDIPVAEVMVELDRRLQAGAVPGINDIRDIMSDVLHLDEGVGTFLAGLTVYATLFGADPAGIVKPAGYYDGINPALFTQDLYDTWWETVWDVVSTHPDTGVAR